MTSTSVKYERQTCTRCGGSGTYSYNQIDGSRCYGCNGKGTQLTKRGRAAMDYASSILKVNVADVPEDVRVKYEGMVGRLGPSADTGSKVKVDGEWVPIKMRDFIREKNGDVYGLGHGILVRMIPTQEQVDDINAYQDSLTKAGKVSKRVKT